MPLLSNMRSQHLSPVTPDLNAARALREHLLLIIFQVTAYPADKKMLRDEFPLGLVKLAPWLRHGLETPEDIANPQRPAAHFALTLMRLGLEIADEYNLTHTARPRGGAQPRMNRVTAYELYHSRLIAAAHDDGRLAGLEAEFMMRLGGTKLLETHEETLRVTGAKFRELSEAADTFLRAAAYEDARRRLSAGSDWAGLTDADRREIVSDVFACLYAGTRRTYWATPADDPEHPVPLRDGLSEKAVLSLLHAEVGRIAYEGSGRHLPRNWWVVKVDRGSRDLIKHSGHGGTHTPHTTRPHVPKIPHNIVTPVAKKSINPREMLMNHVFTFGSRRRIMERARAYSKKSGRGGAEGLPPKEWQLVNTTSRAKVTDFGRALSPMLLGPVPLWNGEQSQTLEAAWQFSKVYREQAVRICTFHKALFGPDCAARGCKRFRSELEAVDHIGEYGMPNETWWAWARSGWAYRVGESESGSREYLRRPMGGAKALY